MEKLKHIGTVYVITCDVDNQFYIGSTKGKLSRRLDKHFSDSKKNIDELTGRYNGLIYKAIRAHGKEHFKISPICEVVHTHYDRTILRTHEQKLISELKPTLNMFKALRTKEEAKDYCKEYHQEHKEEIKEQKKEYRKQNAETIKERKRQYHQANKEKIIEKVKQWTDANKEHCQEYRRKYYEARKAEVSARGKEVVECECGESMKRSALSNHRKTKKHMMAMNQ